MRFLKFFDILIAKFFDQVWFGQKFLLVGKEILDIVHFVMENGFYIKKIFLKKLVFWKFLTDSLQNFLTKSDSVKNFY